MTLKSMQLYDNLTHIVLYTNTTESSDEAQYYITILNEKIFRFSNLYNKSLHSKTNTDLTKEVNQLVQTPAIKDAMKQAQINAKNLGIDIKNPKGSIQGLHQTKLAIDDAIDRLKKPDMSSAEKNKMAGLLAAKDRLVGFLENKILLYC